MVYVTKVHMERGGSGHEHIASVRWENPDTGKTGESSRETMVEFIDKKEGVAKVSDGFNTVKVGVWQKKWLRTHADDEWTDNLLALPRF